MRRKVSADWWGCSACGGIHFWEPQRPEPGTPAELWFDMGDPPKARCWRRAPQRVMVVEEPGPLAWTAPWLLGLIVIACAVLLSSG